MSDVKDTERARGEQNGEEQQDTRTRAHACLLFITANGRKRKFKLPRKG